MAKQARDYDRQHQRNVLALERRIKAIYDEAVKEAAAIGVSIDDIDPGKPFAFDQFPRLRKRVDKLFDTLGKDLYVAIVDGVRSEWTLANNKNNELSRTVFGYNVGKLTAEQYRRYFSNNDEALEAFLQRKADGLDLSDKVWRYTDQFKTEIELGLDLGIRSGRSADEMSRDLRGYLQQPDKLFRRVRDAYGILRLSQAAKAYHPGRGVYRSSYKNARRLAATETNIAYHTADYLRWQQLDFVVGIRVELSNNHTLNGRPFHDICDELSAPRGSSNTGGKGCYPKDFKFTGWHPLCRCHAVTILKTEEEMAEDIAAMLDGRQPDGDSVNKVKDVPREFKDWLESNAGRLNRAKSVPYFMTDNPKYTGVTPAHGAVGAVTGTKLGRTATKVAFKVYEDMPAPTLSREVQVNTADIAAAMGIKKHNPMTFLEANEGRGNISWGKGFEYSENCQIAVAVHEARLRGLNVTALGYDRSLTSVSYKLGERFQDIWEHPKTHKTPTPSVLRESSFDTMLSKLETSTKAAGRYHIGINMKNGGHVITAERLSNGQLIFYDPQSGTFLNLEEYATRDVEYLEILKVDKLLLRGDMFKAIARSL